jgi:folate-dependent phosphoribosylglycinamide formyltransferase PurN
MKIVILATDSTSTWMVVNALKEDYPDLIVALEQPISRYRLLRNRVRKQGVVRVFGQFLFIIYLKLLGWRSQRRISRLIEAAGLFPMRPVDVSIVKFLSANSKECQDWLLSQAPDVVVVNGTRILAQKTLSASSAVFLNTHCGITPAYRGVHGAYWALAGGDTQHAGVTVHVVDIGVDTGDIVYQDTIKVDSEDNFLTYPIHQYSAALPLLKAAIQNVSNGTLRAYQRNDLPSAVWYHPTIWNYLYTLCRRGVR